MTSPRALVVIPAYNEERSVGDVIRACGRNGLPVLVVDDGSDDDTFRVALASGASVVRLPANLGVGAALRCGFRWALSHGFDAVVQVDADGQHDPNEVAHLLEELGRAGADMVIGSRFIEGSGPYSVGRARRTMIRLLSRRVEHVARLRVHDPSSGFRAIGPGLLRRFASEYPAEYLGDTVEALALAGQAGAKVVEHPVSMRQREHGRPSAGSLSSAWFTLRVLCSLEIVHVGGRGVPLPQTDVTGVPAAGAGSLA